MDAKNTEKMKELLLAEKVRIEKELASFSERDAEATETHFEAKFMDVGRSEDENAEEVATYSDNLSLEHELETRLHDIASALLRVEEGTYGVCKYCHKPIPIERLKIRPESSSCVECKKMLKGEA